MGRIRLVRIFSNDLNMVIPETEGAREGEWEAGEGEVDMEDGEDGADDQDEDEEISEE